MIRNGLAYWAIAKESYFVCAKRWFGSWPAELGGPIGVVIVIHGLVDWLGQWTTSCLYYTCLFAIYILVCVYPGWIDC